MDHTVHLEYPQLCIYIYGLSYGLCACIYIYSWVRHRPSEFGGAVARFLFRCFSRMTICSILFHPWTIYVWKKPNKISPCSISMVFCIYIYVHIRDSYTHVVFFHIRVSWKNPNYITIVECIHIPMWYFSQSTMDTAWWYTYPSDKWWSDSHLGWFISN